MAVKKRKKWKTGRLHWPGSNHAHEHNGEADIAASLTPLEELKEFNESPQSDAHKGGADDTIRVGGSSVRVPEQLNEDERDTAPVFRLGPVAVFILALSLAFVAFITWQITLMPAK